MLPFLHTQRRAGDFVRIDRSVVARAADQGSDRELVISIARLARSLDMRVIAGEVDSDELLRALHGTGVDYVQGKRLGDARLLKRVDFAGLALPVGET